MTRIGWIPTMIGSALLAASPAPALEDTPENRAREADRYLDATRSEDMMHDAAEQLARNLPQEQQAPFKLLMTKHLDIEALEAAMKQSMMNHFTADELEALATFYGSAVGQSATKKIGAYVADIMPIVQAEVLKAQAKANREMSAEAEKSGPNSNVKKH